MKILSYSAWKDSEELEELRALLPSLTNMELKALKSYLGNIHDLNRFVYGRKRAESILSLSIHMSAYDMAINAEIYKRKQTGAWT